MRFLCKFAFLENNTYYKMDLSALSSSFLGQSPVVIAGPCSAETEEQTLTTARQLKEIGITIFRAGLWKPRTMPGVFEGVGDIGLSWLQLVKKETGMMVATEVATREHVSLALNAGVDILWIGARTTTNPFAVQEIADALAGHDNVIVLVKNPVNPDIDLWIGAMQRIYNAGITRVGAIHRGFSTYSHSPMRNNPEWQIPIELHRRIPNLAILCDPSHMGGKRDLIPTLSQQALDMGFDGLFIESHCNPSQALSDAEQQVNPHDLGEIINSLIIRDSTPDANNLDVLRNQIDQCDSKLLEIIAQRMEICREIGKYKKTNKIQVVQTSRYDSILRSRIAQAGELGIDERCIKDIMQSIHKESVRQQLDILNDNTNE